MREPAHARRNRVNAEHETPATMSQHSQLPPTTIQTADRPVKPFSRPYRRFFALTEPAWILSALPRSDPAPEWVQTHTSRCLLHHHHPRASSVRHIRRAMFEPHRATANSPAPNLCLRYQTTHAPIDSSPSLANLVMFFVSPKSRPALADPRSSVAVEQTGFVYLPHSNYR